MTNQEKFIKTFGQKAFDRIRGAIIKQSYDELFIFFTDTYEEPKAESKLPAIAADPSDQTPSTSASKTQKVAEKKSIEVHGKKYKNMSEVAREYGVSTENLYRHLRRGESIEEAIEIIIRNRDDFGFGRGTKKCTGVNGEEYDSQRKLAEAYEISEKAISKNIKRKGLSSQEAIISILRKKKLKVVPGTVPPQIVPLDAVIETEKDETPANDHTTEAPSLDKSQLISHLMKNAPDVMCVEEASKYLGIPSADIYSLIRVKEIKSFRMGKNAIRINRVALINWLDSEAFEKYKIRKENIEKRKDPAVLDSLETEILELSLNPEKAQIKLPIPENCSRGAFSARVKRILEQNGFSDELFVHSSYGDRYIILSKLRRKDMNKKYPMM